MDYRLVVLTHGDMAPLRSTLAAFERYVHPQPIERFVVYDGQVGADIPGSWDTLAYTGARAGSGFCEATATAWRHAAQDGPDWVFWLEHDFTFRQEADLNLIGGVMGERAYLGQMAFYRNAVSSEERRHGGYLHLPGRSYEKVKQDVMILENGEATPETLRWFEHRDYWTTNPSLFPRALAVEQEWPTEPKCEGVFGFQLRAAYPEIKFGVWGDGEPWVEHTAERTGKGY